MKLLKNLKDMKLSRFLAIGVAFTLFGTGIGYAAGEWENIWVQFDSVNLTVNGQNVTSSNLLYNDRTYVPLRACAEMLGSTVGWDQNTNTASITANLAGSADTAKAIKELKAAGELLDCFATYRDVNSYIYDSYKDCLAHFNTILDESDIYYETKIEMFNDTITFFNENISRLDIISENEKIIGIFFLMPSLLLRPKEKQLMI